MIYNIFNCFCKKKDVNYEEIREKRLKTLPFYHKYHKKKNN